MYNISGLPLIPDKLDFLGYRLGVLILNIYTYIVPIYIFYLKQIRLCIIRITQIPFYRIL